MKNTIANLSLVFMLSMALASSYAENLSEQVVADNSRLVNPYEGSFSYEASSPVDIQLPNFSHYNTMYNVIKDSLQIDKAYVSDSIRESEFAGFHIVERLMPIDTLVSIIMEGPQAEYSELLHSKFNTIEDINTQINLCDNLIFFSFLYKSYISADVYLCVRTTKKTDIFPFPKWGGYHEMYSFLFQIKGDSIVFIDKIQFHEI